MPLSVPPRAIRWPAVVILIAAVGGIYVWQVSLPGRTQDDLEPWKPIFEERLAPWLEMWRQAVPSFSLRDFRLTRTGRVKEKEYYVLPYDPDNPRIMGRDTPAEERQRQPLYLYSDDRTRFIDPYVGWDVEPVDGQVEAGRDVDTGVALVDLRQRWWIRLFYGGPAGGFTDAMWLDNDTFVVVWYGEASGHPPGCGSADYPCDVQSYLSIFDLVSGQVRHYEGPRASAPARDFLRLEQEYFWRRLKERLPNLKPH